MIQQLHFLRYPGVVPLQQGPPDIDHFFIQNLLPERPQRLAPAVTEHHQEIPALQRPVWVCCCCCCLYLLLLTPRVRSLSACSLMNPPASAWLYRPWSSSKEAITGSYRL